jgi:glycine oxidase
LKDATGIDPEWHRCGMLLVDSDQAIPARLWSNATGKRVEILDVNGSVTLEPAVRPGSTPAIRLPDVAQIRNPRLMDALGKLAEFHGVRVVEYAGACGLFVRNGRCGGVSTNGGTIRGDRVILSAGAWSGALLARVGISCPVTPMRGQMIWYRVPRGTVEHIVIRDGYYLIPRTDGVLVVGSIIDEPGFAEEPASEMTRQLHQAATGIVSQLDRTPVRGQWSGVRPWCPDGLPYIGAAPDVERLFMCVGHHRNGMALAPASARLLVDIMLGRAPLVDPAPFDPRSRMAVTALADL